MRSILFLVVSAAMRRRARMVLLFLTVAGPAPAASVSDIADCNRFNLPKGLSYEQEMDRGIVGCTKILENPNETAANRAFAHFKRGEAYYYKNDYDRMIEDYTEVIKLDPADADAYKERGWGYYFKNDYERAAADYSMVIRLKPKSEDGYSQRASAYKYMGDYARALADYSEAIRLDAKQAPENYRERADTYIQMGDYERAIQDYTQAIKLKPKEQYYYRDRGDAYLAKGDFDHAMQDYNLAIRIDPKSTSFYSSRGDAYRAKGDYGRAIADYDQAIRLDSEDHYNYVSRGDIYFEQKDYTRALADYNSAIRIKPKEAHAYFHRGFANLYSGSVAKAFADFEYANKLEPATIVYALWTDIAAQRNNLPSRLSETASAFDMTAWPAPLVHLYLDKMTPDAVLAAAENPNAKTKNSQVCDANFYSGQWALRQDEKEQAARFFRAAVSGCPKSNLEWGAGIAELKALGVAP
jgi:tetratricopeptide (TPR) repeat protein